MGWYKGMSGLCQWWSDFDHTDSAIWLTIAAISWLVVKPSFLCKASQSVWPCCNSTEEVVVLVVANDYRSVVDLRIETLLGWFQFVGLIRDLSEYGNRNLSIHYGNDILYKSDWMRKYIERSPSSEGEGWESVGGFPPIVIQKRALLDSFL